jgi:hypothetical protein
MSGDFFDYQFKDLVAIIVNVAIAVIYTIQMRSMQKTNFQTQKQLELTRKSLELNKDNSLKELQSYLGFTNSLVKFFDSGLEIALEFKNFGHTPASDMQISYHVMFIRCGLFEFIEIIDSNTLILVGLQPSQEDRFEFSIPTEKLFKSITLSELEEQLISGVMCIGIIGQITYTNIFGYKQVTPFDRYKYLSKLSFISGDGERLFVSLNGRLFPRNLLPPYPTLQVF